MTPARIPLAPTRLATIAVLLAWALMPAAARAQHLWWDAGHDRGATCAYGQITVYASRPGTYYCGANWHPGEPAGGYCGIQHNGPAERRTICSVWDTSPTLHPAVAFTDPAAVGSRFGGEGNGAHTHMPWPWQPGRPFQFYAAKTPAAAAGNTDLRYYAYDDAAKAWVHVSTIHMPNGDRPATVGTITGGGLASFLENFTGQDKLAPRLATYRLWVGHAPATLKELTTAGGDGQWGQTADAYYLAGGDPAAVAAVFARTATLGQPTAGTPGQPLPPIAVTPLPHDLTDALAHLPS